MALGRGIARACTRGAAEQSAMEKCRTTHDIASSETTREVYNFKDNLFKFLFLGFLERKGSARFIIDKDGNLEFKIVHSSKDAQILFFLLRKI